MSEAIRKKLASLLRLSRSTVPAEAELARKMYDRISLKTGITIDDPDAHPSGHAELAFAVQGFDLRHKLSCSLVMIEFGIGCVLSHRVPRHPRTMAFIGPAEVLEEAKQLFELIACEMDKGWQWFRTAPLEPEPFGRKKPRRSKAEFYQGVHQALYLRMADARGKRPRPAPKDSMLSLLHGLHSQHSADGQALAVLDQTPARRESIDRYVAETFSDIEREEVQMKQSDTPSYQYGCRYGLLIQMRDLAPIHGVML